MSSAAPKNEISGSAVLATGTGGLPKLAITTPWSTAEIYRHGGQVTRFQLNGQPPLLWLSEKSLFTSGKAIRGGVPVCFPWFGPRPGKPAHGYARITEWDLATTATLADGRVNVQLRLPKCAGGAEAFGGDVELNVTVGETLTLELRASNSTSAPLQFENCLHSYFTVGDIAQISVTGLQGGNYWDKVGPATERSETAAAIRFTSEVDRVYTNTTGPVEIHDPVLRRIIQVEKSGSASTVVWNPWVEKSQAMADFGATEYRQMVCVESGNVAPNDLTLAPGQTAVLQVVLGSRAV